MKKPIVSIVMGSDSDLTVMQEAGRVLDEHGVAHEIRILSAHRSPEEVRRFSAAARRRGIKAIIAGAGGAAHLAGVIASITTVPVIGVPMETKELKGIDSLLSTVQMPSGVPVATMGIGRAGAKNAAVLAIEILSLGSVRLEKRLDAFKRALALTVREKDRALRRGLPSRGNDKSL